MAGEVSGKDRGGSQRASNSDSAFLVKCRLDDQIYFSWIQTLAEFSFGRYMTGNNAFKRTFSQTYPGREYGLELIARQDLGN